MNHEVIPTQADKICEQGIRDFLFHGEYLNGSIAASHRIAHEAPLLARNAELEAALRGLEPYLDAIVCFASDMNEHEPNRLAVNARAALAPTKETPA